MYQALPTLQPNENAQQNLFAHVTSMELPRLKLFTSKLVMHTHKYTQCSTNAKLSSPAVFLTAVHYIIDVAVAAAAAAQPLHNVPQQNRKCHWKEMMQFCWIKLFCIIPRAPQFKPEKC